MFLCARDAQVFIKRDDMSGSSLSGNKVRKLEFLLADAQAQGCDCVITAGGIQSNHARATAVAARYLGEPSSLAFAPRIVIGTYFLASVSSSIHQNRHWTSPSRTGR